jgi:hypothetical protein
MGTANGLHKFRQKGVEEFRRCLRFFTSVTFGLHISRIKKLYETPKLDYYSNNGSEKYGVLR